MNKSKTNKDEVNIMLAELSEDIVNLMLREHQSIHLELEHVGHLISDASKSLTTSFDELNKITIEQNKIFSLASRPDNKDNDKLLATNNELNTQLKKNQLNIVTALQFDDIVLQLTKHAQSRTRHIQTMFKNLEVNLQEIKSLDYKYDPAFIARISELKKDVDDLKKELQKENPVKQSSLTTGNIELF